MGYFLFPLWGSGGIFVAIFWAVSVITEVLEESEHVIFVFVSFLMFFLLFPCFESGMGIWSSVILVTISGFFFMSSPMWVYIFLEASLLPMMILIMGWGVQPERVSALYYFFVYTFILSSPFLVGSFLCESSSGLKSTSVLSFLMSFAFMVKLPVFLLHMWLPKAHVESPTAGSIILAGILLKMGGIGLMWVQNLCWGSWNVFWFYCALFGSASASLLCALQSDVKSFVAYSSVAHMNYSLVVMCLMASSSDSSSSVLLLSHSFISSLLLFFAGVCFHYLGSRMVYFFRSSFLLKSMLLILFMTIVVSNLSIPPSLGLFGEAVSFMMGMSKFWSISWSILFYLFLVAYYSLLLGLCFVGSEGSGSLESSSTLLCFYVFFSLFNLILLTLY